MAAFSDELIRAAVHTGQFSNPAAEKYLGDVLIKRGDKIASIYLTAVNPIVDPRLDAPVRQCYRRNEAALRNPECQTLVDDRTLQRRWLATLEAAAQPVEDARRLRLQPLVHEEAHHAAEPAN